MANRTAYHPNASPGRATPAVNHGVRLRYLQESRVNVRGPVSGSVYECSGSKRDIAVDPRDAVALEQTGYFQRL